jgi:hypothetical protein
MVAVGDRVICRRNDRFADVDNGTRGTVRATHRDRVVIDTDAGAVRELPAGYVAAYVEHAYCLTGHGMQGGTVDNATVLARPHELTRGWSYTALSRARGATRLHIDGGDIPAATRAERAERPPTTTTSTPITTRSSRGFMRACACATTRTSPSPSSRPARRPGAPALRDTAPTAAAAPGTERARLAAIRAEADRLTTQLAGLPIRELRQLDQLSAERAQVAAQRDDAATRLQALPAPERSLLGRARDPHAADRARLAAAVGAADQQLAALDQHAARLARNVGSLPAVSDERSGLERRLAQLGDEGRTLRDALAEQHVAQPPAWARELFGERPAHPRQAEQYDRGVRQVARYPSSTTSSTTPPALGPSPTTSTPAAPGDRPPGPCARSSDGSASRSSAT